MDPTIPSETSFSPWETVSAFLFSVQQSWFRVDVDYFSTFRFVRKLPNLPADTTVNATKTLYSENVRIPIAVCCWLCRVSAFVDQA